MRTLTRFLLEIPNPVMDEIELAGGLKLYMDTSFDTEFKVCTTATASVIPSTVKTVNKDDSVALSYHVVSDREFPSTDDSFFSVVEPQPYYEKYKNSKGWWITKQALQLPKGGLKWAAVLQDNYMELIDGAEGTQSQVERWLSQFKFGNEDNFTYKNLVNIDGKKYWKTEDFNIFAKKVNEEIICVSDRVICKPIVVDFTSRYSLQYGVILPEKSIVSRYIDRGEVIASPEGSEFKKGDIIGFEPKFCEKYTLWGLECFLIKIERVDVIYIPKQTFITNKTN